MSILPLQPSGPDPNHITIEAPAPSFHPHSPRSQTHEEIFLDFSTFPEPGRPPHGQTLDMADESCLDRRGCHGNTAQSPPATTSTRSGSTQGFGDFAHDPHPNPNFSVIPSRPPLRPTPSYSADSPFSYYASASLDLEHKSMAVAAAEEAHTAHHIRRSGFGAYACVFTLFALNFLCGVDTSALAAILPTFSTELRIPANDAFWIVNSYLLSAALIEPLAMRISSALGTKIVVLAGLVIWTTGSLGCALSVPFAALIGCRCLCGAGAGIVGVSILSTLQQIQGDRMTAMVEKVLSLSLWLGLACGPVIGLAFAQTGNWRYLFFVDLVVGTIATLSLCAFLRLSRPRGWVQALREIEYLHWFLLPATIVPLAWALSVAGTLYSWISWHTILPLFASVICLISWCICGSISANPILPVSILRHPVAFASAFGSVVFGMIVSTIVYFVPLLALASTATLAAQFSALLPWTLALAAASLLGWNVESRVGQCIPIIAWPLLSTSIGLTLLLDTANFNTATIPLGIISGLALGVLASHLSTSFQSAASTDDETIHASPMQSFLTTLGYSLGIAMSSCIFLNRFGDTSSDIFVSIEQHRDPQHNTNNLISSLQTIWLVLCVLSGVASAITVVCALIRRPSKPQFVMQSFASWSMD